MKVKKRGGLLALATVALMALLFRFHLANLEENSAVDVELEKLPYTLGEWKGEDTIGLDVRSQEILKLNRYVKRKYTNPEGDHVLLYVGYWKKQTGDYQAAKHSPLLCLPSNGWFIRRQTPRTITAQGEASILPLTVKRLIGEIATRRHLFYYWFFTGEKNYSDEWKALLTISLQTFFAGRSDGGIIEISAPMLGKKGKAYSLEQREKNIEDFISHFYPALRNLIVNREDAPPETGESSAVNR